MLVLTRTLQQAVLVGEVNPVRLSVFAMFPGSVSLQFQFKEDDVQVLTLNKRESYTFKYIAGQRHADVRVELVSVIRGEVRLAFHAPQWVKIDREERRM